MFGQEHISAQNDNGAHQFLLEIMKILEYSGSNLKQPCIHKNDSDAHQCLLDTIRIFHQIHMNYMHTKISNYWMAYK
jgi:hypothetical protein